MTPSARQVRLAATMVVADLACAAILIWRNRGGDAAFLIGLVVVCLQVSIIGWCVRLEQAANRQRDDVERLVALLDQRLVPAFTAMIDAMIKQRDATGLIAEHMARLVATGAQMATSRSRPTH